MSKENDLEGAQDQGGKHGGQKGMPKSQPRPLGGRDPDIVRDERAQEKPGDEEPAQQVNREDVGGAAPGARSESSSRCR
jgi:hypothetical protein